MLVVVVLPDPDHCLVVSMSLCDADYGMLIGRATPAPLEAPSGVV